MPNMNNTFIFLRHAETQIDKATPISKWGLTEKGITTANKLAKQKMFDHVDVVITSEEQKASNTAKPITHRIQKTIIQCKELNELDRDKGKVMEKNEYEKTVEYALTHPKESKHGWEPASNALQRFEKKVAQIDAAYENKTILIVGHAYTINLYFAKLQNKLDRVHERLQTNTFCSWGIIKNQKVIKDI